MGWPSQGGTSCAAAWTIQPRNVALDGSLCAGMSTPGDCESAIATTIGTPVGTTGAPTVSLYYNLNPTLGPNEAFVCASVGVQSYTGFFGDITLSSSSASDIEQPPNPALQNTPDNCPAPLQNDADTTNWGL